MQVQNRTGSIESRLNTKLDVLSNEDDVLQIQDNEEEIGPVDDEVEEAFG